MKNLFLKIFKKKFDHKRGFTLVETIFYLVFLVVILTVVISFVISISKTYQTVQATKNLESSAVFSLERMTREIRNAVSVNVAGSALATETGALALHTTDASGAPQTVKFYLDSTTGVIDVDSNGTFVGPLTLAGVTVDKLEFQLATSTNSQVVKIDMTLTSISGSASTTKNFHDTIVLRNSH